MLINSVQNFKASDKNFGRLSLKDIPDNENNIMLGACSEAVKNGNLSYRVTNPLFSPKKTALSSADYQKVFYGYQASPSFKGITRKKSHNKRRDSIVRVKNIPVNLRTNTNDFTLNLSRGIKSVMDLDIPAQNLKNIVSPENFTKKLKFFTQENFISSEKNQEAGIYCADLDYQSNFSNGSENVFDILDKAAKYSEEYYKKTGKDFMFALADRDAVEGLQHVIRLIGENPEKYKHLKLVPAVKLTFAHNAPTSAIKFENSELLVYGINPFSKNLIDFIDTLIDKRRNMTLEFIRKVNKLYPEFSYNILEFAEQNKLKYHRDYTISNLYWRAREYAETKGDVEIKGIKMVPENITKETEIILNNLGNMTVGSNEVFSALGSKIIDDNSELNKSIKEVFHEYSTHIDDKKGRVVSSAENLYYDLIDCLSREPQHPVIAVASPFYLSHYFEEHNSKTYNNVIDFISYLKNESNGMLMAFESVAPDYKKDKYLSEDTIKRFNNSIREELKLYEVGGSFKNVNN